MGKQNKINMYMKILLGDGYHAVSGKIFNHRNEEVSRSKLYKRTLMSYDTLSPDDVNKILSALISVGDEALWPELPIVTKAKALGPLESGGLTWLEDKQYVIINRLLFHPEDEVLFITTGVGGSGKSTYLNLIKQLFGNDFSSASLSDLSNQFTLAEAVKHRLICSDELARGDLDCQILKTLASKQPIFANPKGSVGYNTKTQSALFWCCNKAPRIDCTDTGILRRIVFYSRNTKIENPDTTLNKQVFTEDELLSVARKALCYEDDNWKQQFMKETHQVIMSSNSVEILKHSEDYSMYAQGCRERGLKAYSEPNWQEIRELFNEWREEDAEAFDVEAFDTGDFMF